MVKLLNSKGGMNSLSFEVRAEKGDVLVLNVMIPGGEDGLFFELEVREERNDPDPVGQEESRPELSFQCENMREMQ